MYAIYLVFITSIFLHLPARLSILGVIRFDLILYILLSFGLLAHIGKYAKKPSFDITKRLLCLIGYILISLPLVKWPGSVIRLNIWEYVKVVLFFFFTLAYVNSESRLKTFMLVFLSLQIFRAVEPTFLHITTGYWGSGAFSTASGYLSYLNRLSGAPTDVVNPNQLAWVIVNSIPFAYFLVWKSKNFIAKIIAVCLVPVLLYPFFLTASRTGLVILIIVIIAILLLEGLKPKVIFIAAAILIPSTIVISGMLSADLTQRYLSLFQSDVAGADTARGRIDSLINVIDHMSFRAIFGHGLGTSAETNVNIIGGRYQPTHNMYLEAIQEIGIVGLILLLNYIYALYRNLKASSNLLSKGEYRGAWLRRLSMALIAWILMDLVYSLACFALTHWEWYLFGGLSAVCVNLIQEKVIINSEDGSKQPQAEQPLGPVPIQVNKDESIAQSN